jgi:hypothetical protein
MDFWVPELGVRGSELFVHDEDQKNCDLGVGCDQEDAAARVINHASLGVSRLVPRLLPIF